MDQEFYNNQNQAFLQLRFEPESHRIYANWIGYISHNNAIIGTNAVLKLLEKTQCAYLLNDNRQGVGPWEKSNCYLEEIIFPKFQEAGLRYMAHVLSPGISGALSAQDLHRRVGPLLQMKLFGDFTNAENWLKQKQVLEGKLK